VRIADDPGHKEGGYLHNRLLSVVDHPIPQYLSTPYHIRKALAGVVGIAFDGVYHAAVAVFHDADMVAIAVVVPFR